MWATPPHSSVATLSVDLPRTQQRLLPIEIQKLEAAGYVTKISPDEASKSIESWYFLHHLAHHNGKDRIVFSFSFQYKGQVLNDQLLPGFTLGPTLLGVLLRFRQHGMAISGEFCSMFNQALLLAAGDKPIMSLRRNMQREKEPEIYECQVLPFGTACSIRSAAS